MIIPGFIKYFMLLFLLFFLSCNMFGPDKPDEGKWYMTGEALVVEGKIKMWEGDWEKAIEYFSKALVKDSSLSEAYFYIGKCILRIHDVNLTQVWDEIKPKADTTQNKDVPFLYAHPLGDSMLTKPIIPFSLTIDGTPYVADTLIDSVFLERKRIYDAVYKSIKLLEKIHLSPHYVMDGKIKREQYESDYLVEVTIKTVLGITDLNNNGILDWEPRTERDIFRILCRDIKSLDEMKFDSLKHISKNPRDIKSNLDSILTALQKAEESFNNFKADLIQGSQQSSNIDTSMADGIGDLITDFNKILPYFYYDDFKDNDSDSWHTDGDTTTYKRMVWIDWDWDKKVDIYAPKDTALLGHHHIGDSLHMAQNPHLYELVDTSDKEYKRYRYKGTYTYEFIAGDWGVDEEILDGFDNDRDGFVDEDTRITADTLDDDGDWFDNDTTKDPNSAIGQQSYNPMRWQSVDPVINILGTAWDTVATDSGYFILHNADYNGLMPLQLPRYIGDIDSLGQPEYKGGDYGMDEEWYDGYDNDNDGLIDEDVGEYHPPASLREYLIELLRKQGLRGNQ